MTRSNKEIIEIVNKIESEFPVNTLIYKNIKVWPLVRFIITKQLFDNSSARFVSKKQQFNWRATWKTIRKLRQQTENKIQHFKKLNEENNSELPHQKQDAVFLSETYRRMDVVDGLYFNKYTDPYSCFLKEMGKSSVTLEYVNSEMIKTPSYNSAFIIQHDLIKAEYKLERKNYFRTLRGKKAETIKSFSEFRDYCKKNFPALVLDEVYFVS